MKNEVKIFFVIVLIGMVVFVLAEPVWNSVAYNTVYYFNEDAVSSHNFTANLSDVSNLSHFLILDISWGQGLLGPSHSDFYWLPWEDSGFANSTSGVLEIGAISDNETGNVTLNVYAQGAQTGTATKFYFVINATNDIPFFTNLNSSYNFPESSSYTYTVNALDEEQHYPLNFNLTFLDNCTHASWSGKNDGENCSIFNLSGIGDNSVDFFFDSPTSDDVGTYWANFSATDFNGTCPHVYCDVASYEENKSSGVYLLRFNVFSSLSIDVSNCTGAVVMENETFNCTINVTTMEESESLNFSSYAFFASNPAMSYDSENRDWFYSAASDNASSFFYSLPVSVTPSKNEVGNWTINFTVESISNSNSQVGQIEIFVNYNESAVVLDSISGMTLYENANFSLNAYDNDLLIWDSSVKDEVLTFASNTSWVSVGTGASVSGTNYSTSLVRVNYTYALSTFGEGNYSVRINVSDVVSNVDSEVFVVEILNESAPVWNTSLNNPVVLNLTEGLAFGYNLSLNVSDYEEDVVTFYYNNGSVPFCSLTTSNFNSNGMINFTPVDCDVGIHNVSIVAGDGKLNSSWNFVFNVSNVADAPTIYDFYRAGNSTTITNGSIASVPEGITTTFILIVEDDDFLIPAGQKSLFYNESLVVNVTFTNSTGGLVNLFNFSFSSSGSPTPESVSYSANFTPSVANVGSYTVFINVSDVSGLSVNRTWFLEVAESLDAPVLSNIENVSLTVYDYLNFTVVGVDDEDDFFGLDLNYSIAALDSAAPGLTIGLLSGVVEFNMSSNQSYAGAWRYNVTVNDSDGSEDWQVFYLFVYGLASLVSPAQSSSFNLTENVSSILNFTINHSVGDNLTYEFWIDNMSCVFQDNSNCSYGNLTLRELHSFLGDGNVFGWNFTPNFLDETYDRNKNLTVRVYPNSTELTSLQRESVATNFSFKFNISHTNAPMRNVAPIGLLQADYNSNIDVDLSQYFEDEDVDDSYYLQNVTFIKSDGHADISVSHLGGWDIQIGTILDVAFTGFISILGNDTFSSDVIEDVEIKFTQPETAPTSSGGGSGSSSSTKLKFYSLRIIVPEDIIISDQNYIDVPFGLENAGTIDLSGIDLSSAVLYNNAFSDDVKIDLGVTYIDSLKSGERKDYTMRILADTDRSGKYKATLFANISSPKFFDWGDFFIDLRRTNESEAEEVLIFTEQLIADNPECLELTEVFRRAQEALAAGNEVEAIRLATEVSEACEDAINANEQIRYRIEGFVERNFYYISFITLVIFFIGFIFYVYKRVKFNKSADDAYAR